MEFEYNKDLAGPQMVPHSREAEEALIGSAFINPESVFEVQDIAQARDFYIHRNQWIWEAIISVYNSGEPVDTLTIAEELDKRNKLADVGGAAYITKLINQVPSSLHAKAYAKRVSETAIRRRMLERANLLAIDAYDENKPINDIVADHTKEINEFSTVEDTGQPLGEIVSNTVDLVLERIAMRSRGEKIEIGYQTGIGYIDRNFKGLKKGWLVYDAGSPNVGKTKKAIQISAVLAQQDPGSYIALEGDGQSTVYRLLEGRLGVSATDIEFGKVDGIALLKELERLEGLDYEYFYVPRLSITELRTYVAKQKADRGIGWIVIDYVSLLTVPGITDKNERDEAMSAELRRITGEFNILTWGLDSIVKSGANKILSLEDIAGRFSKQHDSDITFGYSDYRPIKGICPEIDDLERKRKCRLLRGYECSP